MFARAASESAPARKPLDEVAIVTNKPANDGRALGVANGPRQIDERLCANELSLYPSTVYHGMVQQGPEMAIQSFASPQVEAFFLTGKVPKRAGWAQCSDIAKRKLDMLHAAADLKDLKDLASPPGNRLEALKGDWAGFWSIRINQQWRVVFQWNGAPYQVDIVDDH